MGVAEIASIFAALVGLLILFFRWRLMKNKTRAERAVEIQKKTSEQVQKQRLDILEKNADELQRSMDTLQRDIDAIRRLRKKES